MFGQKVVQFSRCSLYANDLININKRFTNFFHVLPTLYMADQKISFKLKKQKC